jgi:hypothetical protein
VTGDGTPGTVPVWTGPRTLGDSPITTGATVDVAVPLRVDGGSSLAAIVGTTTGFSGVAGLSLGSGFAGVRGFNNNPGISVGVWGLGPTIGVFGSTALCADDFVDCITTPGIAGLFWSGPGGTILRGARVNPDDTRDETINITADGDLRIAGSAYKPGGGSWSALSDMRAKAAIQPLTNSLGRLLQLHGVTFEYTDAARAQFGERSGPHMGMVAQQVEQVFPSWIDTGTDGYKRLTFRGFEAVAVEAVRELDARVTANSQEALVRIADLERENADLRLAIEALSESIRALQRNR